MGKLERENKKRLKEKKHEIVKSLCDSDLSYDDFCEEIGKIEKIDSVLSKENDFCEEIGKIEKIDSVLSKEEKPKMDGQTKAAIIKVAGSICMVAGIMLYESRGVIHSKTAMNIATKM